MALVLPQLSEDDLSRSPIAVVLCQVRYEQNLVVSDGDTIIAIHDQLGGRGGQYPVLEPVQATTAQIEVGPFGFGSAPTPGLQSRGWRLRSKDAAWTITIMPDVVTLETTAYNRWKGEFKERFRSTIAIIADQVKPSIEERVGLRYVNRLMEPGLTEPRDWIGVVAPELLGPLHDSFWANGIRGALQQIDLDAGDGSRCLMRHGFIPAADGQVEGYVLDYDVFRQTPQRFDVEAIVQTVSQFHRVALALFQKSLTPDYLAKLR